jgi:ankyrin repeat protein
MAEGAIRREAKARAARLEKEARSKEAASRAHERALRIQRTRSATFAAARRGDDQAVKSGVYEHNVAPVGGEWLESTPNEVKSELLKAWKTSATHSGEGTSRLQELDANRDHYAMKKTVESQRAAGTGARKHKKKRGATIVFHEDPIIVSGLADPKETLLHLACKRGDLELVKWLCNHGELRPQEFYLISDLNEIANPHQEQSRMNAIQLAICPSIAPSRLAACR